MLVVLFVLPAFISCASVKKQIMYPKPVHVEAPFKSFSFVTIEKKIKPKKCLSQENIEECKELLPHLPEITTKSNGSGIVVLYKNKKAILSAAHVCLMPKIEKTDYKGFLIQLQDKDQVFVQFPGDDKKYEANIIKINNNLDLCLLEVKEKINRRAVQVSPNPPRIGDKIINIAAPFGIYDKNMTLIFDGRYAGVSGGRHYYTIPARPGSSGSIVLNSSFQIVGTVNVAVTHFETLGIGTGWKHVKYFLKE